MAPAAVNLFLGEYWSILLTKSIKIGSLV